MITTDNLLTARFDDFEPALRDEILESAVVREAEPGDILLKTGQEMAATLLLLDGRIKVYREDDEGNDFLLYYLESGSACAMSIMCAINKETSNIMAVAETETTLLAIPFDVVGRWMTQYLSWNQFIINTYLARFDELLEVVDNIAFKGMDERLVFYLKRMVDGHGPQLNISHQDIARDLNSAREVISRLLKKLEQRGAVELGRNEILVKDLSLIEPR